MTDQGKPSVCPVCGSDDPKRAYCCLRGIDGKHYCGICPNHAWHSSPDQSKPSVCPTCGSANRNIRNPVKYEYGWDACGDGFHDGDSSPVPAATPTPVQVTRIEEIAEDLAAAIYEVQQGTDEMAIKTLLLDFAKEIQRAAIEPTGF